MANWLRWLFFQAVSGTKIYNVLISQKSERLQLKTKIVEYSYNIILDSKANYTRMLAPNHAVGSGMSIRHFTQIKNSFTRYNSRSVSNVLADKCRLVFAWNFMFPILLLWGSCHGKTFCSFHLSQLH